MNRADMHSIHVSAIAPSAYTKQSTRTNSNSITTSTSSSSSFFNTTTNNSTSRPITAITTSTTRSIDSQGISTNRNIQGLQDNRSNSSIVHSSSQSDTSIGYIDQPQERFIDTSSPRIVQKPSIKKISYNYHHSQQFQDSSDEQHYSDQQISSEEEICEKIERIIKSARAQLIVSIPLSLLFFFSLSLSKKWYLFLVLLGGPGVCS